MFLSRKQNSWATWHSGSRHSVPGCDRVSFGSWTFGCNQSHHNVGGLPEKMKLKLIEPLRELFKDEVRLMGRELGALKKS